MPTAPPRVCRCGLLVAQGQRCPHCTRQRREAVDARRGTSSERGYDAVWRKVRAAVLTDEPLCRQCYEHGKYEPATEVHHTRTIAERPDLRLDRDNLVPLCKACHSAITLASVGRQGEGGLYLCDRTWETARRLLRACGQV